MPSLHPEYPAHSETALRAAAPDPLASARAHPEGLGSRRARGSSFDLHSEQADPQRGREFAIGGPEGDNGLSEGSSLSTITDRASRSVGGAFSGRIRTRWTSAGRCGPASWPSGSFAGESTRLASLLGWAPGGDAPFLLEASTTQGGLSLQLPRQELPPEEWFSIRAIVGDLELNERDWAADLLGGYFSAKHLLRGSEAIGCPEPLRSSSART